MECGLSARRPEAHHRRASQELSHTADHAVQGRPFGRRPPRRAGIQPPIADAANGRRHGDRGAAVKYYRSPDALISGASDGAVYRYIPEGWVPADTAPQPSWRPIIASEAVAAQRAITFRCGQGAGRGRQPGVVGGLRVPAIRVQWRLTRVTAPAARASPNA